jgi:hypothetical protein
MSAAFWIVFLAMALMSSLIGWCFTLARAVALTKKREQLMLWLRGNLLIMRAHVSRVSPEATAVITTLENALNDLAAVNAEQLENYIYVVRMDREARLMQAAKKPSCVGAPQ